MPRVRVEFTVEPFVEGHPGAHVLAAWEAVEATGFPLLAGPFSSEVELPSATVDQTIAALVRAALSNGAERVSLQIERVADVHSGDEFGEGLPVSAGDR